ncbi:hypothetical protein ESCO_005134 [Escovopsis weberi]|uniref:Uncharacterized protein n=1 Tax=Escovopsis weberi TaxID=150374 RepID=A0A0M8MZ01_ESCWE|nr:hypothetical protein ESCO_005134 [Escovopsis weberi]
MPPADRTRQPQLGASATKSAGRSPLVAKVPVKPAIGHTPPTPKSHRDDAASATAAPTVAYVNTVPARSGPRPTRGNSAGTTPSATPNPDRHADRTGDSWESPGRPLAKPPLIRNESHASSRPSQLDASSEIRNDSNKFFYASEVKPAPSLVRPSPGQQKAASTFFYASEAPPSAKRNSNPSATPSNPPSTLGTTQEGVAAKFFYANGAPEISSAHSRPPLAAIPSSGSGSSASTTSKMLPGRPGTGNGAPGYGQSGLQRPESPAKTATGHSPQNSRNSSLMLPTSPTRSSVYAPSSISSATNASKRRVSIEAPPLVAKGHGRTGSAGADAFNATKFIMPTVVSSEKHASSAQSPSLAPVINMASILKAAEDLGGDEDEDDEDEDDDSNDDDDGTERDSENSEEGEDGSGEEDSDQDSYSASRASKKEPVSDYVLSARRERKVQDLEIRNTSLEAINKTLERQLRKQSAELRRFRRLSRAGKLPDPSTPKGQKDPDHSELSDLSEEESVAATNDSEEEQVKKGGKEEEEEEDEDEDEEEDNSFVSEESSSTASASGSQSDDVNRRKRDERRLELDLTRHQELLKDSQKINQSLKRCLNWTGELIKEGQKALAYQVRVSDVQFGYGGRVLRPDEDEDDTSHQADETLTNVDSDTESAAEPWAKGPQDRDSGIELPVDSG